jgi:tagatose-6-phosphate ketose/aldose isomerase
MTGNTTPFAAAAGPGPLLGRTAAELRSAGGLATAREIAQQPALWRECATAVRDQSDRIGDFRTPVLDDPRTRVILTGAGTSAFIGQILAPGLARTLRRRVDAIPTTDLVSNPLDHFAGDAPTLLVSFARSGDSPESVAATRLADQHLHAPRHLIVTCNPSGALAKNHAGRSDSLVLTTPAEADDVGFAMTSSFTCMLLTARLSLGAGGTDIGRLARAGEQALEWLPERAARLAGQGFDRVVYLGSGPLQGLAREAALKMLELTAGRVTTWFDSPLGFRHGPKAVINDRTLVVVLASGDAYTRRYDDDIIAELGPALAPGGLVVVTADGSPNAGSGARAWALPDLQDGDDATRAAVLALPAQILALEFSLALGAAPDNPFPAGEVTRVVEGVHIHQLDATT